MTAFVGNGHPVPEPLSPKDKDSFAYPTMKDRVPVIICKVVDLLYRDRMGLGLKQPDDLKKVIEQMSRMRYEILTNKQLKPIEDERPDAQVWNQFLAWLSAEAGTPATWFGTRWLSVECFVYRRLLEAMSEAPELENYDFFGKQKRDAFYTSLPAISSLMSTRDTWQSDLKDRTTLEGLIKISLWGNKCDLSISAGSSQSFHQDPLTQIEALKGNLLVDGSKKAVDLLLNKNGQAQVDIIMDNAGFELISDLCLADYLISNHFAVRVRFRVKNQPWFVSDTTPGDIDWLLSEMSSGAINNIYGRCEKDLVLAKYGDKWKSYVQKGVWTIHPDSFWTYPHDFSMMRATDPQLYSDLSLSDILIFKGDLNYRKLVGDLKWRPTDTFEQALQGFHPAPILALRTLKADVVTGLLEGQAEACHELDKDWMINGNWGVIQFC